MTSERWRQIELVYHAALEREPKARTEYVAEACGGDEDLRKEVESLLAKDASSPELVFNRARHSDGLRQLFSHRSSGSRRAARSV